MKHFVTIDVENVYRGLAITRTDSDPLLTLALLAFLDVLRRHKTTATFFILGADARAVHPVLRQALTDGHAIACHGSDHQRIDTIAPSSLPGILGDARRRIEDQFQTPCRLFRAPYFSVRPEMDYFFDGLAAAGFTCDSSLRLPLGTSTMRYSRQFGILERPVPLVSYGGMTLGILGGLALKVIPVWYLRRLIDGCARAGQPACIYLHPYEWYSRPVTRELSVSCVRRTWRNGRTLPKLEKLLRRYQFTALDAAIPGT